MAEKRMFAKTIIDSDAFLDMPLSTQCLYFHLCMRADDDGFLNNPRKIQRTIGANDNDFDLLIAKKFLIPFDTGIVVIKHWKIHNYIQKDRYHPTSYQEEKACLRIKDNKAYTLELKVDTPCIQTVHNTDTPCIQTVHNMDTEIIDAEFSDLQEIPQNQGLEGMDTECIQDVYSLDTQIRLDKNRLDKNSKKENIKEKKSQKDILNNLIFDEDIKKAFLDYLDMRKKIKKPMTDRALVLAVKELKELYPEDKEKQIACLEQSIFNSWQGLFPLREIKTSSSSGQKKTQFNNFSQRQGTDFDAIEQKMTGGT